MQLTRFHSFQCKECWKPHQPVLHAILFTPANNLNVVIKLCVTTLVNEYTYITNHNDQVSATAVQDSAPGWHPAYTEQDSTSIQPQLQD